MHTNSGQGSKYISDWFADFDPSFAFDRGRLQFYNILGGVIKPASFSVGRAYQTPSPFSVQNSGTTMPGATNLFFFPGDNGLPGPAGFPGSSGQNGLDGIPGQDGQPGGGGGDGFTPFIHRGVVTAIRPFPDGRTYQYDLSVRVADTVVAASLVSVVRPWTDAEDALEITPFEVGETVVVAGESPNFEILSRELPTVKSCTSGGP